MPQTAHSAGPRAVAKGRGSPPNTAHATSHRCTLWRTYVRSSTTTPYQAESRRPLRHDHVATEDPLELRGQRGQRCPRALVALRRAGLPSRAGPVFVQLSGDEAQAAARGAGRRAAVLGGAAARRRWRGRKGSTTAVPVAISSARPALAADRGDEDVAGERAGTVESLPGPQRGAVGGPTDGDGARGGRRRRGGGGAAGLGLAAGRRRGESSWLRRAARPRCDPPFVRDSCSYERTRPPNSSAGATRSPSLRAEGVHPAEWRGHPADVDRASARGNGHSRSTENPLCDRRRTWDSRTV
jgi:hypothetical protein